MMSSLVKIAVAMAIVTLAIAQVLPNVSSSRPSRQNSVASDGGISGRVLDADGHPIRDALVLADNQRKVIRPMPTAWTNTNGEFTIQGLPPGLYSLHCSKQEAGYPRTEFNFYNAGENTDTQVKVYEHQTSLKVVIQLGPKAAVLVGRIVDATTNSPVREAQITVRRFDRPERFLSTGLFWHGVEGGFKLLVPALPFTLKVSAVGYQDWYYKSPGERKGPARYS
jgi:hypothetical protein